MILVPKFPYFRFAAAASRYGLQSCTYTYLRIRGEGNLARAEHENITGRDIKDELF